VAFSLIQPLADIPLAFVDVETNGCSAAWGYRVIEVGIVRVQNGQVTGQYQQLIDPRRRISPQITAMTGITPGMCAGQPTFAQQLPAMLPFLAGAIVVGHNIRFDLSFLTREMTRAGLPMHQAIGGAPVLDTLNIARKRFGRGGNNLGVLSRRLGIEPESEHRALPDARTTWLVFKELITVVGGWQLTLADLFLHQGKATHLPDSAPDLQLSRESRVLTKRKGRKSASRESLAEGFNGESDFPPPPDIFPDDEPQAPHDKFDESIDSEVSE
jgi:DNA polymerase III epsilon subunit family exonuclease